MRNYISKRRTYLIAPLISFIFLILGGGVAFAAPQEITMTPTSASPVIAPGATYTGSFQVINSGPSGYSYTIYGTSYHISGENYTPRFTALPNTTDASQWFNFSKSNSQSNPGETTTFDYTIHVPSNTPPGGYYATVFAQTESAKSASSGVALSERVGEIFYIQVAGPVTQKGEIVSWSASTLQSSPITAIARLENSGGLHYGATVNVSVKDLFGNTKYTYSTLRQVLPQTTRQIPAVWKKSPIFGLFKITGDVSYLNTHTTLKTKWVLVVSMPIRIIIGGGLALLVTYFISKRTKRLKDRGNAA